jgi:glycosyltransferase involved in cell wall biosynthesis
MEEAWRDIKVLVVPSLWFEAWGIVLIEAHLRGIPVISSDAGAIPEAMLGLNYIIPVNPIKGDRNEKGAYIVPDQDIEPWVEIVNKLMNDRSEYEEISIKVRNTTSLWLKNMDESALENWLLRLAVKSGMRKRADSGTTITSM